MGSAICLGYYHGASGKDALEKEMATHSSILVENPMDRGAWWATVHRVTQSWTQLKGLSTHAPVQREYLEEKGTTEDEMVGWHHRLNAH